MLEEGSFRGRTADFVFMFILGGVFMVIVAIISNIDLSDYNFAKNI